jgi:ABC-type multidrug transport system ATPase subunit
LELIGRLKQRRGLTIVYFSSSLEDVIGLADNIHILDEGREVFSGTPREILARVNELVALDITLPEAAQIAFALREVFPTIRTDVVSLEELEVEIHTVGAHLLAAQNIPFRGALSGDEGESLANPLVLQKEESSD